MYSPSFSFFLYPFFLSLFTKQWHVAGLTVALHPFPPNQMHRNLTQSTLGTSWHVISSSFSFPRFLFPSTSFLSLSFSTPVPFSPPHTPSNIHFQNHSASMTEVTWLRGQHRVTFASPQHFQTQWRGRMSRGSECLQKPLLIYLFKSPGGQNTPCLQWFSFSWAMLSSTSQGTQIRQQYHKSQHKHRLFFQVIWDHWNMGHFFPPRCAVCS